MIPTDRALSLDDAESLALQAFAFLAGEPERLGRFLSLTGVGPADLKAALTTPGLQAAVISYLRSDESLLLVFAATVGIEPASVGEAERLLSSPRTP
jgi:hypothetical protein